jgi:hypothetical protein
LAEANDRQQAGDDDQHKTGIEHQINYGRGLTRFVAHPSGTGLTEPE